MAADKDLKEEATESTPLVPEPHQDSGVESGAPRVVRIELGRLRRVTHPGRDTADRSPLRHSVSTGGMINLPTVIEDGLGEDGEPTYFLAAGNGRVDVLMADGVTHALCIVYSGPLSASAVYLAENSALPLNPLDEAEAIRATMREMGLTQDQVAKLVGRSRPAIANLLALLKLEPAVAAEVRCIVPPPPMTALLELARAEPDRQPEILEGIKKGKARDAARQARALDRDRKSMPHKGPPSLLAATKRLVDQGRSFICDAENYPPEVVDQKTYLSLCDLSVFTDQLKDCAARLMSVRKVQQHESATDVIDVCAQTLTAETPDTASGSGTPSTPELSSPRPGILQRLLPFRPQSS